MSDSLGARARPKDMLPLLERPHGGAGCNCGVPPTNTGVASCSGDVTKSPSTFCPTEASHLMDPVGAVDQVDCLRFWVRSRQGGRGKGDGRSGALQLGCVPSCARGPGQCAKGEALGSAPAALGPSGGAHVAATQAPPPAALEVAPVGAPAATLGLTHDALAAAGSGGPPKLCQQGELGHLGLLLLLRPTIPTSASLLPSGLTHPLYKKGPVLDPGNRMLAVDGTLYRLYANVLREVVIGWCQEKNPNTQFGFYPGHNTLQPMFILRHLQHAAQIKRPNASPRLLAAFIDFKQAYDTIPREALWTHLQGIRMPSCQLTIIKSVKRK
eukprot:1143062-Pelagomonas_calceolata.AAC.3